MSASIKGLGTSRLRTGPSRDLDEVDVVVPPTAATFKRAQRYVASESHYGHPFNGEPLCDVCVADARELLGALGLLPCDFWSAVAAR